MVPGAAGPAAYPEGRVRQGYEPFSGPERKLYQQNREQADHAFHVRLPVYLRISGRASRGFLQRTSAGAAHFAGIAHGDREAVSPAGGASIGDRPGYCGKIEHSPAEISRRGCFFVRWEMKGSPPARRSLPCVGGGGCPLGQTEGVYGWIS